MNRDRERFDRDLERYLELHPCNGEKEFRASVDAFIRAYNAKTLTFDLTPEEARHEAALAKLAEAEKIDDDRERALLLAHEAIAIAPDCNEARHFVNASTLKGTAYTKATAVLVEAEKAKMTQDGWFADENIGHFWTISATRPYMRLRYDLVQSLIDDGRYAEAVRNAEDMLRLNTGDNMGIRYVLAALYARRDDLAGLGRLNDAYPESNAYMLLPSAVAQFRAGHLDESKRHLIAIQRVNRHLASFLCGLTEPNPETWNRIESMEGYASGSLEEAYFVLMDDAHLIDQNSRFLDFAATLADVIMPKPRPRKPRTGKPVPHA